MSLNDQFSADFRTLNRVDGKDGHGPLKWQIRLFEQLCANDVPSVCDLPTGMGKTSIIHLWLLALRHQIYEKVSRLPTRLVYVVDRRTVVDQATDIAVRIKRNLDHLPEIGLPKPWLYVSTLRGHFADNREWTADPSRPAIIIGTVDMIGSRLLFSGYRSSYKWRPLDAGLLGQDTLLVLDEAHLSQPFEKLIRAVSDQGDFQRNQGMPMRVMSMSATTTDDNQQRFKLESADLEGDLDTNPIIQRYQAKKKLALEPPLEKNKIRDAMVKASVEFVKASSARVVVFTQKPEDAFEIDKGIRKHFPESVAVLTGTMRGLERDELLKKNDVLKRFLDGDEKPGLTSGKQPAFLVSTSAGEVGFDLNADHMVCDAAPIDSMIQRLGRVNRRGYGEANIRVFVAKVDDKAKATKSPSKKRTWESATATALICLKQLPKDGDGTLDASPRAIDQLKRGLTKVELQAASSPTPDTVRLTDVLLDVWSMTTITARMPGRPPVAPWLRGLSDEEPQTTIAWRAELDVAGFGKLDAADIEEWFDAHRVLPHETLAVPTSTAGEWILRRWKWLSVEMQTTVGERPCIVDRAGLVALSLRALVDELEHKRTDSIRSSDIILPAAFGGIQRGRGLLDENAPRLAESLDTVQNDIPETVSDVADIADEQESHHRVRSIINGDEPERPLVGAALQDARDMARFELSLPADGDGDTLIRLISRVPKRQRLEYGTNRQTLRCHVGLVEKYASNIGQRIRLSEEVFSPALRLAAEWHDKGKDRERWQKAAGRKAEDKEPLGKSGGFMGRIAGGYRHEFGSLREFADAFQGKVSEEVFNLAMHMIAAHHGRGRPHFPKGGFDPDARAKSVDIALDAGRRFAILQRHYGYWQLAWLENLLRCADAMASGDKADQV
jgi:CRISPR-associated endonuclease/helicase Cas3